MRSVASDHLFVRCRWVRFLDHPLRGLPLPNISPGVRVGFGCGSAVSSVVSIIGTIVELNVLAPAVVEAQETRIRAESVVVVDESGTNRVTMGTGPIASRSAVSVFSEAGISRAYMSTVGFGGVDGDAVNLVLFAPEGRLASGAEGIARLGAGAGGVGASFHLADRQGQIRIWLQGDSDGNPSIEMRDASGNVTWSAQ